MADVLYRPQVLEALQRYDGFRRAHGYEPIADEILNAIERKLLTCISWDEIPAPTFRVRGEIVPVKRVLVTVRSKRFKVYLLRIPRPRAVGVAAVRHPGQRPIER